MHEAIANFKIETIYSYTRIMRKRFILAEEISTKSKGEHGDFAWTVLKLRFYFSKRLQ